MVIHNKEDKKLVVPSALGNFGGGTTGGGSGMTPEEVEAMIDSAITDYDIEIQVDLEDIRENVSGNTEDIATLSGFTGGLADMVASISGTTSSLASSVDSLAGAVTGLTEGFENLSGATSALTEGLDNVYGQTTANTQDIESVSGAVETLSESLSGYTTTDTFNQAISGLTGDLSGVTDTLSQQISGVSADVEEVSGKTQEVYDAIFYEDEGETYSQIDDLWGAVNDKQNRLNFGSGLTSDGENVTVNKGHGLNITEGGKLEIKFGNGVEYDGNDALALKIGEGLAFSGDTLVVSGGSGGEQNYVIVDSLDEIEEPYDGMVAYVRTQDKDVTVNRFSIDEEGQIGQGGSGDVGYIEDGDGNRAGIHIEGTDWYWNWKNDGDWHLANLGGNQYTYRTLKGDNTYDCFFDVILPEDSELTLYAYEENGAYLDEVEDTITEYSKPYVYRDDWWTPVSPVLPELNDLKAYTADQISDLMDFVVDTLIPRKEKITLFDNEIGAWVNYSGLEWQEGDQRWHIWLIGSQRNTFGQVDIFSDGTVNSSTSSLSYSLDGHIVYLNFGNDERGRLTYDADNGYFIYDGNNVATGDTVNFQPDLVDYLITLLLRDGSLLWGEIYVDNYQPLDVISGGVTTRYVRPTMAFKPISYDVGDRHFIYEITYVYADWKLKIDIPEEENGGINLRITAI